MSLVPVTSTLDTFNISNPYLDEIRHAVKPPWLSVYTGMGVCVHQYDHEALRSGRPEDFVRLDRHVLVAKYAWAIPTDQPLRALADLGRLVEIGAGTGYWAWMLRQMGVDVVAYDLQPPNGKPKRNGYHPDADAWTEVRRGGAARASFHPDRALFLCWPPYRDSLADRALRYYDGNTVAVVGEDEWGCTGDEAFFRRLNRGWDLLRTVPVLQYDGIHDELTIWRRK